MKVKNTLIWGDGGHAKMIYSLICNDENFGKIHLISKHDQNNYIQIAKQKNSLSVLGVGDLNVRLKIIKKLEKINVNWVTIISHKSIISKTSKIGLGTVIMPGVIINNNVEISKNCIINTGSIIEHDCKIGDNSFVGPGSVITGGCIIGKNVTINSSCTLAPNVNIFDDICVGAKSFVNKNLNSKGLYYGIPVKFIK